MTSNTPNSVEYLNREASPFTFSPASQETQILNTDPAFLQKIAGTYEFDDGSAIIISEENNKLYSQRPNESKSIIYSIEKNKFYLINAVAEVKRIQNG